MPAYYVTSPVAGLGQHESSAFHSLPETLRAIVKDEMDDPESRAIIVDLLREKDPEKAIVRRMSAELTEDVMVRSGRILADAGHGGLKKAFKKVAKKVGKVVQNAAKKVGTAVQNTATKVGSAIQQASKKVGGQVQRVATVAGKGVQRTVKRIGRPVVQAAKKHGMIVALIVGSILAPFTGGASLAVVSVLAAGKQLYDKRKEAAAAKKAAKADAAALEEAVAIQEGDLDQQLNDFWTQYQEYFLAAGYDAARWNSMSVDAKLGVIDKINAGEMPAAPEYVQKPAPAPAPSPSPVPKTSVAVPPSAPFAPAGPSGTFDLIVEGKKVASASTAAEIASKVEALTKPGDRFEILFNGESTGIKIRTGSGAIDIPSDVAAQVRGMTHEQVQEMLSKSGAPTSKGGFPWWILLGIPVAYAAAKS